MASLNSRKRAILIVGTHRSGTSALTRVLSILGGDLPRTLLAASGANETGFWESTLVNRLNDDVLAEFGQRWFDVGNVGPFDVPRLEPLRERALHVLQEEFGDAQMILLKDPRVCRLIPFWLGVLAEFGAQPSVVLPVRNPLEVSASIFRRNGIDPAIAHYIWLRDVLDAELASRTTPRTFMRYDALLEDWRDVVDRIARAFDFAWPNLNKTDAAAIDAFVTPKFRHHFEPDGAALENGDVSEWVGTTFEVVDRWARHGEEARDLPTLDRVREAFDAALPQFNTLFKLAMSNRASLRQMAKRAEDASASLAQGQAQTREQALLIDALNTRLSKATADLAARVADGAVEAARVQALKDKLSTLAAKAAKLDADKRVGEAELKALQSELSKYSAKAATSEVRIARLQDQFSLAQEKLQARHEQAVSAETKSKDLALQLSQLNRQIAKLESKSAKDDARIKGLSARLQQQGDFLSENIRHLNQHKRAEQRFVLRERDIQAERDRLDADLFRSRAQMAHLRRRLDEARRGFRWPWHGILSGSKHNGALTPIDAVSSNALFDADWYRARYPDVAASGVDPATHYLVHGAAEGRDPGPFFNTRAYLDRYPDVSAAGVNPLFHFLEFGASEGRAANSAADVGDAPAVNRISAEPEKASETSVAESGGALTAPSAETRPVRRGHDHDEDDLVKLIVESPFWNVDWYLKAYPRAVSTSADPALHFLKHAASENLDPGPEFSSSWYLERNPHVARMGINPFVHYLLHGRANGRPIAPSAHRIVDDGEAAPPRRAAPPFSETGTKDPDPSWLSHADLERTETDATLSLGGVVLGLLQNAEPDDPGSIDCGAVASAAALFCRLHGIDANAWLRAGASGSPTDSATLGPSAFDAAVRSFGSLQLGVLDASLADIWFPNDRDLRLRVDCGPKGRTGSPVIRAFQFDPQRETLSFLSETPIRAAQPNIVDIPLINPYLPLLICWTDAEGRLLAAGVLPFPSLCRGATHYAELCALAAEPNPVDSLMEVSAALVKALTSGKPPALGEIEVDLTDATGAERIFSSDVAEWLGMSAVPLTPKTSSPTIGARGIAYLLDAGFGARSHSSQIAAPEVRGSDVLTLPAVGVPSLSVIAARAGEIPAGPSGFVGSFVVASTSAAEPEWLVRMPPLGGELIAMQPAGASRYFPMVRRSGEGDATGSEGGHCVPLAVMFRDMHHKADAALLMPVAPDAPGPIIELPAVWRTREPASISVLIAWDGASNDSLNSTLASLRLQAGSERVQVVVESPPSSEGEEFRADLPRHFNTRSILVEHEPGAAALGARLDLAASHATGELLLLLTPGTTLHDSRTLSVLAALALTDGVASAGCLLLAPDLAARKKAALKVHSFGRLLDGRTSTLGHHLIDRAEAHVAVGIATVPVAANRPQLAMMSKNVLLHCGGFAEGGAELDGIGYWQRALQEGWLHLCTTAVSATLDAEAASNDVSPSSWGSDQEERHLIGRAAALARLRG